MMRMKRLSGAVLLAWSVLCATVVIGEAHAADFVVNSIAEPGDGTCDSSECTLREAINSLSSPGDQVVFDFSGSGLSAPFEIEVTTPLEVAQSAAIIDGFACTGCGSVQGATTAAGDGFNSVLAVRVIASAGFVGDALVTVSADSVTLLGLNLDGSPGNGITVTGEAVTIEDCFVGTDIEGGIGLGNTATGIEVADSDAQIGPGNVLSGNGAHGVHGNGTDADTVTVFGNIVGLDRSGEVANGNSGAGVYLVAASGTLVGPTVGGATGAEGNVISGNIGHGILIELGVQGTATTLIGNNIIGLNGAGSTALGNGGDGIRLLGGTSNGSEPDQMTFLGNVISGNGGSGVHLQSAQSNTFSNNTIGTDSAGVAQLGNGEEGIYLFGASGQDTEENVIGGVGLENVIAYNAGDGIRMQVTASAKVRENTVGANSIYNNAGIGIDIEAAASGDGAGSPPPNTCSDANQWGNRQASAPVLSSASLVGGVLSVVGVACPGAVVDIYTASSDGEPESYQGTGQVTSAVGAFAFAIVVAPGEGAGDATALQTDTDGETGEAAVPIAILAPCDLDGDGVDGAAVMGCMGTDCDDGDEDTYPGAIELCDGVDNDCDFTVPADELDGDVDNFSECEGDCDDTLASVNPSALEVCDGLDNDCADGVPDDETDDDGDGFNECGDGDCDDSDIAIFVGAAEICDGADSDCDSVVPTDETDDDGDSYNECDGGDCDDVDASVFPGAIESCNGVDDDCDSVVPPEELDVDMDGLSECGGDCDDTDVNVLPGAVEICDGKDSNCDEVLPADEADADGDGAILCDDSDCDDLDATVYEGAPELCDGVDNDCDGDIDEIEDLDLDGVTNCDGDCDDLDPEVYPGAVEICDGKDSNCDSAIGSDELDIDADGLFPCNGDCDDDDPTVYEGAEDICDDGVDQDCDGEDTSCEEPCDDADLDGDGMSECDGDCDDADASVSPAAPEICDDGLDQDCDSQDVPCADMTLDEVPPPGCDCAASVSDGGGASSAWVLVFGGLLLRRRRRKASWSFAPLAAALAAMSLMGCVNVGGGSIQTWWGNMPEGGAAATFEAGGGFVAGAVAQAVDPMLVNGRSVVEVVLGGDRHPLTCDGLALLATEFSSLELALLESLDGGDPAELAGWACQELRGVAREVFGGDQWHAVHALLEPGDEERARPASSSLVPGAFIARVVDLSGPGALAPEPGSDGCAVRVATRLSEGPLEPGFLAESAVSRLAHKSVPAEVLTSLDLGSPVQVGMLFPEGLAGPAQEGAVDLTGFAATDSAGVFDTVIFSTEGDPVTSEPCAAFSLTRHLAWPDVGVVPPEGSGDDDDDDGGAR